MHDIIPSVSREEKLRSLGWLAIWWIETFCVVGSKPAWDVPMRFSPEYAEFLVNCYAHDTHGRRLFGRVFLSRPKGCNKSGLAAMLALFESLGPCRFDHWAEEGETFTYLGQTYPYRAGEPVGRFIQGPDVMCLATAEDQTGNVYDVIRYNCESGPLAQLRGDGLDPGATRIMLPNGGVIRGGSSGASSKDGGLQSFLIADETHLYNTVKLHSMFDTVKRNLSKRGDADPWILETTTMFRPGEESVAEDTFKTAWAVQEGKTKHDQRVLFDHRYSNLGLDDIGNEKKLMHALMESYGSAAKSKDGRNHLMLPDGRVTTVNPETGRDDEGHSLSSAGVEPGPSADGWFVLEQARNDILSAGSDVADSIRYFMNSLTSVSDAWLPEADIQDHLVGRDLYRTSDPTVMMDAWKQVIRQDEEITLGFDGSISDDSTALVGCRVRDGLVFLIKLAVKPDGPDGVGWLVDRDGFDGMVRYMMEHYNVVAFFADVTPWETMIAQWENDFSDVLAVGPRGRNSGKIRFWTNTWQRDVYQALVLMAGNFRYPMKPVGRHAEPDMNSVGLLADPRLVDHFRNARRRDRSFGYLVFKETPNSPKKIDAMMAGLLAYTARNRFLTEGEDESDEYYMPIRVY